MPDQLPDLRVSAQTFHPSQAEAYRSMTRYTALRCGRRWGKSALLEAEAVAYAARGGLVGFFAPDYRRLVEPAAACFEMLAPITRAKNKDRFIQTIVQNKNDPLRYGTIDFWTLNDEHAGRGRKYDLVILDEAAFGPPNTMEIWERAIEPTLLDYGGRCIAASNTNGIDSDQFFWRICNEAKHRFGPANATDDGAKFGYWAPSASNPLMSAEAIEDLRASKPPLVFRQEYEAKFVDWSGAAFFDLDKLLVNKLPVQFPRHCDAVFCTIDTAVKTGKENDGTAVIWWALNKHRPNEPRLVLLDWDVKQIEGADLSVWLPNCFLIGKRYAEKCGALMGYAGALIEDKSTGMVLIQHAKKTGAPVKGIDSKLTAEGKDGRAVSVSGYHYMGDVKISQLALEKTTNYKGSVRNHLVAQIVGFRMGDKDAAKREDDLLDCYCYGLATALGDYKGF